jgi:hypothetical protein
MSEQTNVKSIVLLVLYAVALAVGVFGVVIPFITSSVAAETVLNLYGISIFCLGLAGIMQRQ